MLGCMVYRPYPNRERALAQVQRHTQPAPVIPLPPALQPLADGIAHFREGARRAVEAWPVDEYRLSTRPQAAGGGA